MGRILTYAEKANRDAKARELKAQGIRFRKSSVRNQLLHPMYVEDRKDTPEGMDLGFGNTVYKTPFAVLYEINIEEGRN